MSRILITICISLLLVSTTYATDVVIGNWETSNDTWTTNGTMNYGQTVGVSLGSYSEIVDLAGWGTALKYTFGTTADKANFMQHSTFSIDFSVAASGGAYTAGYTHLQKVIMNNATAGYTQVSSPTPAITYYWWGSAGERKTTLVVDYTAYRDAITDVTDWGTGSGYIQIFIETQTGGGAPTAMYFDKAVLGGIPEPATMALLGLGGLALIRRKR
jgi:hypothetical protein